MSGIELKLAIKRRGFALDVETTLPASGVTGVYGPSGAGKTTLLRIIAGLEAAAIGRVVVDGEVWQDETRCLPAEARAVGYVFQEPRLFSHLDVSGNLDYAAKRRAAAAAVDVDAVIELLGIDALLTRRVQSLSGGEAQRVAIARALLRAPRLLLMDEPLAAIDRERRDELLPFLDRLHGALSLPIVYVSHSIDEIGRLADHLLLLRDGRLAASGPLQTVLADPGAGLAAGEEAGVVVAASVVGWDATDGLTELHFSGGPLYVAGRHGENGQTLRVRIRAVDVSVARTRPADSSILNCVSATIDQLVAGADGIATLKLRTGDDWLLARVTQRSVRELKLQPGDAVYAQLKTASIRNLPSAERLDRSAQL